MSLITLRSRKQPRETKDYIIGLTDWFSTRADLPATIDVVPITGVTVTAALSGYDIVVTVAGGTAGATYHIELLLTTSSDPAIVREIDLFIAVREN